MSPAGLGARVALAAATAIVLAVALLGAAAYALLDRQLRRSLDHGLRERAAQVARLNASAPALLTSPGALDAPVGGRQLSVQVVDRRRRVVARSLALGGRLLPAEAAVERTIQRGRGEYVDARLGAEPLRLYVAPLADLGAGPAAGGAVIVASSTADVEAILGRLRLGILVSALLAGALAAGAATLLTRQALRPVERLSAAAAEIERTGDASRRLPEPASVDELGRLAHTLNAMLAALERAREVERRFIADASHELRTPLTALRGNAAYVARHGADPAVLADLEHGAERLSALLDDLLALAREDAAPPPTEEVRLDELARSALAGEPQLVVEAFEPVTARGDPLALERALMNLVENARVHGPEGGQVTVWVRRQGDRALVEVADEGPGLRPAEAELAFKRFWRGDAARGRAGSGLGLAIVRTTAERHGGEVRAAGSRFTIDLPAVGGGESRRPTHSQSSLKDPV